MQAKTLVCACLFKVLHKSYKSREVCFSNINTHNNAHATYSFHDLAPNEQPRNLGEHRDDHARLDDEDGANPQRHAFLQ